MDRSSWSAVSKDPSIWKKVAIGAGSLLTVLPTPIALGIVNLDLEKEAQRIQDKEPPSSDGTLPSVDEIGKLLMSGIGPCMVYAAALLMFAIATIPLGLSYFQLYAYFRPPNELVPELHTDISVPFTSVVLYFVIALVGLGLQALVASSLPIALAQYARGKDLRPALDVVSNAMTVFEMGSEYWVKAAGVAFGLLFGTMYMVTSGFGLGWVLSTVLGLLVAGGFFISLVLSSRHALAYVAAELPPMDLPPLPPTETTHTLI